MDKKITILDVARVAGVSKGTVDRVIHNRGEVASDSAEKVRKAVKELGYKPNIYASILASHATHLIACILPEASEGEYWDMINEGIIMAEEQVSSLGLSVRVFYYDQYDVSSFKRACAELLASAPSAVVVPPFFKADTVEFVEELYRRGIPYVYVDSKLEDEHYFAYFGMPMYKSGSLCGALLTERCPKESVDEVVIVRIIRDKNRQSDPSVNRRTGFLEYMGANFPRCNVSNVFINPSDPADVYRSLDRYFEEHPNVKFVVTFNSRLYLTSEYFRLHPLEGRRIIGFDNLDGNLKMLRDGIATIVITQHTRMQSKMAVISLADWILMHKKPEKKDNYLHMDILTRYNIDNF